MIDILMATYNGEKYISSQIYSLFMQTYPQWKLIIHDDGSTDRTLEIIKKLQKKDDRICLIEDGIKYRDAGQNFLHLLSYSQNEFCIFCDQDDIWLENKLEVMFEGIKRKDNTKPQAVYSNAYVYDCEKGQMGGHATLTFPRKLNEVLFMNAGIQGCAIMFNKKLKEICFPLPGRVAMHDHVITLAAVIFGEFSYIDARLMLYRRYEETVTGDTPKNYFEKITHFFDRSRSIIDRKHYEAAISFYNLHKERMNTADRFLFEEYIAFPNISRFRRFYSIIKNHFSIFDSKLILLLKVIIRKPIN